MVMCGGEDGLCQLNVGLVDHLALGTPCLLPASLETSSPYLPLGWGGNKAKKSALRDHGLRLFVAQMILLFR
jgi:hypothetical protein